MIDLNHPEVRFAVEAVRAASVTAQRVQQELAGKSLTKEDKSPVTVADFAAQAVVAAALQREFPHDVLVGEEDASALREPANRETLIQVTRFAGQILAYATPETVCAWIDLGGGDPGKRFWTLDPIDGTKGFLRGDQYAVALALLVDGEVRLGILGCPHLTNASEPDPGGPGSIIVAQRGAGAWSLPLTAPGDLRRLRVSDVADLRKARVLRSYESGHTNVSQLDIVLEKMGVAGAPVLMDSQAKYAVLASGLAHLLFRLLSSKQPDYRERIWDQAAGSIIVEEAGGRITDLDGKPLDFTQGRTLAKNRGVVASNGALHDAALAALR